MIRNWKIKSKPISKWEREEARSEEQISEVENVGPDRGSVRRIIKSPFYWRTKIRRKYDPARHWGDFESKATCYRKQRKRINLLRKICSSGSWAAQGEVSPVLTLLEGCRKGHRCGSPSCALCMRQYRRWFVSEALYALRDQPRPLYFTTLILHEYLMPHDIDAAKVVAFRDNVMKRLQATLPPEARLIGWVEVSWEADQNGFMAHLHAVSGGCSYKDLRTLKPKRGLVPGKRPLVVKKIKDGDEMAVTTYTVKQFPPGTRIRKAKAERREAARGGNPKRKAISAETRRLLGMANFRADELIITRGLRREKNGRRLKEVR